MALNSQVIGSAVDDFIEGVSHEEQLGLTNQRSTNVTDLGLDKNALEVLDFKVQLWEVEVTVAAADAKTLEAAVNELQTAMVSNPTLGVPGIMKSQILRLEQTGADEASGSYKTVLRIKVENKTS